MIEVARATVTIVPTMQGAQQTITNEMVSAGDAAGTAAGKAAGKSMASSVSSTMSSAGGKLTKGLTLPLVGFSTASVTAAADFETSFSKLLTIADTVAVPIDTLRDKVMDLSTQTGRSSSEIAEAAYSAISAGQDTADALKFVESASKLAKGGFTGVSTATDVLTTALNAYGLSAEEVTHVSDVLIETQNEGKTTVSELSSVMGKVIPTAAAANVEIEDLASQFVALTKNGIGTAEASTYINGMLNELTKSGTNASDTFMKAAGVSFPEYIRAGHSTTEAIQLLSAAQVEAGLTVSDAFGSAEAGKAANVLVQHAEDATTAMYNMQTQSGQTEAAFLTMEGTAASNFEKLKNNAQNLAITFGETVIPAILPVVEGFTSGIRTLAEQFEKLPEPMQEFIVKSGLIVAAAGPVLSVGGKVVGGIQKLTGGISGLVGHLSGATTSLGSFGSSASTAASGASAAGSSFAQMGGQALLLMAAGAAILLVATGIKTLTESAISLSQAGPGAVAVLVLLAGTATGMTAAIVAIGSASTASAAGLLALGAAVLMISGGIAILVISLAEFCEQLPTIAEHGGSAALVLVELAGGVSLLAVGAAAGAAANVAWTASVVATEVALVALLAEMLLLDAELVVMAGALILVDEQMSDIAASAKSAAGDLEYMVGAVDVVDQFLTTLKDTAGDVLGFVVDLFSKDSKTMSETGISTMTSLTKTVTSGANDIKNIWTVTFVTISQTVQTKTAAIVTFWSGMFVTLSSTTRNQMTSMKSTIQSTLTEIQGLFANTRLSFNQSVKLPHFSMSGSFDAKSGRVPTVNVSWYRDAATQGARFSSPTVIGVGDAKQPELLIGETTLFRQISEATGGAGDTIIPVYIGDDLIDTVVVKANQRYNYRSGGRS